VLFFVISALKTIHFRPNHQGFVKIAQQKIVTFLPISQSAFFALQNAKTDPCSESVYKLY
jgi:hypothetical protein